MSLSGFCISGNKPKIQQQGEDYYCLSYSLSDAGLYLASINFDDFRILLLHVESSVLFSVLQVDLCGLMYLELLTFW